MYYQLKPISEVILVNAEWYQIAFSKDAHPSMWTNACHQGMGVFEDDIRSGMKPTHIVRPLPPSSVLLTEDELKEMMGKLKQCLKMMEDRRHDTAGLGGPMAIIKEILRETLKG